MRRTASILLFALGASVVAGGASPALAQPAPAAPTGGPTPAPAPPAPPATPPPPPENATPPEPSAAPTAQARAAQTLFDEGRKALADGDLETACGRFRASDQLDPAPGTKANLAECEERRGHLTLAKELARAALTTLKPDDPRRAKIEHRLQRLEPLLPKLVLTLAPGASRDTTVREGDASLAVAGGLGVPLPLDPGVHHLQVTAPGCAPRSLEITLVEGKTETLQVPTCVPEAPPRPPERSAGAGPWVVGGLGLALLVVGGVTGGLTVAKKSTVTGADHCVDTPAPRCPTQTGVDDASAGRTLGYVSTATLVTGAAMVAGAGIWLGLAKKSGPAPARVGFSPAARGGALRVEGSW